MKPLDPLVLHDFKGRPIAVQISYENWLVILESLRTQDTEPARTAREFREALKQLGDGMEYQRRLREEWQ